MIIFYYFISFKVLGNGEVLEFDRPSILLSNTKSYFVSLVEQTGATEAEYLRTLANQMDSRRNKNKSEKTVDDELISSENENDPLLVWKFLLKFEILVFSFINKYDLKSMMIHITETRFQSIDNNEKTNIEILFIR